MAIAPLHNIRLRGSTLSGRIRWRVLLGTVLLLGVYLFFHFVVPILQKLNLHAGLSYYDLGLRGFMPISS